MGTPLLSCFRFLSQSCLILLQDCTSTSALASDIWESPFLSLKKKRFRGCQGIQHVATISSILDLLLFLAISNTTKDIYAFRLFKIFFIRCKPPYFTSYISKPRALQFLFFQGFTVVGSKLLAALYTKILTFAGKIQRLNDIPWTLPIVWGARLIRKF